MRESICFIGDEGHGQIESCPADPPGCSLDDSRFVRRGVIRPVRRNAHSPPRVPGAGAERQIESCVALARAVFNMREGLVGREGDRCAIATRTQYPPPLGAEGLVAVRSVVL